METTKSRVGVIGCMLGAEIGRMEKKMQTTIMGWIRVFIYIHILGVILG